MIGWILLVVAAASIGYTLFAIVRVRGFADRSAALSVGAPPVTILKPLHGDEPLLYENLRSLCLQEYPQFQIVFCAADANDPALAHARRLQSEFPSLDIAIGSGRPGSAPNPKIANLQGAIALARHDILAIADSDIRVPPGHLHALAGCFEQPGTSAATFLYGGMPSNGSVAAQLGAMFLTEQFAPSVLVAAALEPLRYCLGGTMAVRRATLEEIGGLDALGAYLADDYMLGRLVAQHGGAVVLAPQAVSTMVHERSLPALWAHEVRWARTVRAVRPWGFAGSLLTLPLLWALVALFFIPPQAGVLLYGAALAARFGLHLQAEKTLGPSVPASAFLVPFRDGLTIGAWCAAFLGRRIGWRGAVYAVAADGRMLGGPGSM